MMSKPKQEKPKGSLKVALIDILINEHSKRREQILGVVGNIADNIDSSDDEVDKNIAIEHFNDIMESSVKNDTNIVKLVELLLKYNYDGDEAQIEKVKKYSTKLSENKLNVDFDQDE